MDHFKPARAHRSPRGRHTVAGLILGWGAALAAGRAAAEDRAADLVVPSAADFDAELDDRLRIDLRFLTDDKLAGRSSVEDPIDAAADYLERRMAQAGLRVDTFGHTARQPVPIPLEVRVDDRGDNQLVLSGPPDRGAGDPIDVHPGDALMPMAIGTPSGLAAGPVVFAGYGITAPEYGYDDYAGLSVAGKIVVLLRKEPGPNDDASPFDGSENTSHAYFETKIKRAIDAGAVAVLIVNNAASLARAIELVDRRIDRERERLADLRRDRERLPPQAPNVRETIDRQEASVQSAIDSLMAQRLVAAEGVLAAATAGRDVVRGRDQRSVPVASIGRTLADQILAAGGYGGTIETLEHQINQTFRPASVALAGVRAELRVALQTENESSDNVVASLPGRGGLAEQCLVLGAHYDHIGLGGPGSLAPGTVEIHNGADDNASGTAVMVAAAGQIVRRLAQVESHRRVIFIAFTGEERGLLGSEYYVDHPRWPIQRTVAMINLDMVGRLQGNDLTVYGTGTSPAFGPLLDRVAGGFDLTRVPGGNGPSDHASFFAAGVPVLFYFTGLHRDYHRPSDDYERLNVEGMVRITELVVDTAVALSTIEPRPTFADDHSPIEIRRQR